MYIADQITYRFSADDQPLFHVRPGEPILFKTQDCYTGQVTKAGSEKVHINYDHCNPATGPIWIEGAEPGDILVVDILDIQTADSGVMTVKAGTGPLCDEKIESRVKILPIENGITNFNGIRWQVDPMIGVIGTAPAEGSAPTGRPFPNGGNMDCKQIKKGSRVYLPVQVEGARLGLGDLHASMGDGEVCGTGLEVAGEVLVTTKIIKQTALSWPVVETPDMWYVCACDLDVDKAIQIALLSLRDLMTAAYGWDSTDAFMYLSLRGSVEINQSCLLSTIDNVVRAGVEKHPELPPLLG